MVALCQTLYFILHNGRRRTPLHIMNAQAIHEASKSKTLITSFNHFSLSVNYDELLRYHNNLAKLTVESSRGNVPLPSHFDPGNFTTAAFDNFDHEECTSSGIGGTYGTVAVLFQDKPIQALRKPYISESPIEHGSKVFNAELPVRNLKNFSSRLENLNCLMNLLYRHPYIQWTMLYSKILKGKPWFGHYLVWTI